MRLSQHTLKIGRRAGKGLLYGLILILSLWQLSAVVPFFGQLAKSSVSATTRLTDPYTWGRCDQSDFQPSTGQVKVWQRGVVSLTFDDGWKSIHREGLPLLEKYGIPSTQYALSGYFGAPSYMTPNEFKDFKQNGHQIASHTVTHDDLTQLPSAQLAYELANSKKELSCRFGPMDDFASPLGHFDDRTLAVIKQNYRSHRSTQTGFNTRENFDIYNIRVQNITPLTEASEVAAWLEQAERDRAWLVLVYHQITNSPNDYDTSPQELEKHLTLINKQNIKAATIDQVLDEITAAQR